MHRNRIETSALLLCGLFLFQCTTEDRRAGTSTTVGNTVTGVAVLSDGSPAAHAEVTLRSPKVRISRYGTPSSTLIAFTTADSAGAFTLPRSSDSGLYLEVTQAPESSAWLRDSLQTALAAYPASLPDSLGTLTLARPGALAGRILAVGGISDSSHWIGAQGTDNFTPVKSDGSFRLDGLAPGTHILMVVDVPDLGSAQHNPALGFSVRFGAATQPAAVVKSGEVVDLGGMLYFTSVRPGPFISVP